MPGEQILAVKAANKSFRRPNGEPLVVLEGVDLTLKEGELVGLLGRSGSGKSTLLRLIAGLSQPNGGSVEYLGRPVAAELTSAPGHRQAASALVHRRNRQR